MCPAQEGHCPITDAGRDVDRAECELVTADGARIPILKTVKQATMGGRPRLIEAFIDISDLKRAEEALRLSEQNQRITLESIGDAVIATGTDGRVERLNPIAEELTGWPREEAAGQPLSEVFTIINARTDEPCENLVDRVIRTGGVVELANDTTLIARDGSRRQIADSAAPIRDDDGAVTGVVIVFHDVTEEYAARKRIRELNERFTLAIRAAGLGIWDVDLATETRSGTTGCTTYTASRPMRSQTRWAPGRRASIQMTGNAFWMPCSAQLTREMRSVGSSVS